MKRQNHSSSPEIFIITAPPQSGKTTYLALLVEQLKLMGYKCGGFLAPGKFENGRRSSFDILDLKSGTTMTLCSIHLADGEKIGSFSFSPNAQLFGRSLLHPQNLEDVDFVVIDEIGPLEMNGGGWADCIVRLLKESIIHHIWVVRQSLVEKALEKFEIKGAIVLRTDETKIEDALKEITLTKQK